MSTEPGPLPEGADADYPDRADELEAELKASKERVGDARIMAGLILSAYDPATPADRAAPTAAAAIERAHRFLLDTKPAAISPEEGG